MVRDRWAQELLTWRWQQQQFVAEISRCRYFCRSHGREVLAWCELADISGGRRVDVGLRDGGGCEGGLRLHAAARCRRDDADVPAGERCDCAWATSARFIHRE
jgi:hypothetical protein